MIGRSGPWGKCQLTSEGESSVNTFTMNHERESRGGLMFLNISAQLFQIISEIIERVSDPSLNDGEFLRPGTFHLDCGETILKCLESCWEEDPEARPDFRFIRIKLKEMQAGL